MSVKGRTMISLTPEQVEYKEKTLNQLLINQSRLEASLAQETRPDVIREIEVQLEDVETHINRLQDELAGNIVFDEPVADELFRQAVKALAKEKFFLAKKYIHKLEIIEPFYPALDRLHQEAETGKVSRRTRSIAQGTATSYPGTPSPAELRPVLGKVPNQPALPETYTSDGDEEPSRGIGRFFQFHVVVSCLVVLLILCVILSVGGVTLLQWLIEG